MRNTVWILALGAAAGGFLFGFDTAVINGAVPALRAHFDSSALGIGLAVSLALLGSAVGAFAAGPMADRFGRVPCMRAAALFFLVSAVGSGFPFALGDFIAWRVLGGIGVGMASVLAPTYIAEIAPAETRGRLATLQQLAIVVGIFVSGLSNYALGAWTGGAEAELLGWATWRWMFWVEAIPAAVYGAFSFLLPESPRYLVARGRDDEAGRVLVSTGQSAALVDTIRRFSRRERPARFRDVFGGRFGLLPVVWVGVMLAVFQQFVGINVVFYYSNTLWQSVGFDESRALAISLTSNTTNVLTTFIAIATIDRFGRRPLLLVGSIGMALSLGTVALALGTAAVDGSGAVSLSPTMGLVALVAANAFVFAFGFSWGPVMWVLLGEMFNNRIRAAALALGSATNWVANFVISTSFPVLVESLGVSGAYLIYAVAAALSFVFVLFAVPETKGRSLEEMD
ncbi:MAG: sugar porter family MFS transporter [Myxococcota bacterium]